MNVLAGLPAPAPAADVADASATPTDGAAAPTDGTTAAAAGPLEAIIAAILAGADATATPPTIEAGTTADADVPADEPTDGADADADGVPAPAALPNGALPAASLVAALLGSTQAAPTSASPSSPQPTPSAPETAPAAVGSAPTGPVVSPAAPTTAGPSSAPDVPSAHVQGGDPAPTTASPVAGTPDASPADGAPPTATPSSAPAPSVPPSAGQVPLRAEGPVENSAPTPSEASPAGQVPAPTDDTATTTDTDAPPPVVTLGPDASLRHLDGQVAPRPDAAPVTPAGRTSAATPAHHVELPTTDPNVARIGGLVRTMAHGEVRAATLTLNPADLGEVRVELRSQDGVVSVHLSASHPEGLEALRNSTGSLRRELERAGLGLDRVDVGFSGDSPGQSARQGADDRTTPDLDLGPAQPIRPFTPSTRLTRPTRPIPIRGESGLDLDL